MKLHRSPLIAGILVCMGTGLLVLSSGILRRPASPVALIAAPPLPTSTWGPMPTRAPLAPVIAPTPAPDLAPLQRALLLGDLETADRLWNALETSSLAEEGATQLLGARLAFLQGDLKTAEARGWQAVRGDAQNAEAWSLLGVVLSRAGKPLLSAEALARAASLNPALADSLFEDRWRVARQAGNLDAMTSLAGTFSMQHPDHPLEAYYRGRVLLAGGEPLLAMGVLIGALEAAPDAPAVLWYTLGEAYLARHYHREAVTVLEVAASKAAQGDESLRLASDDPLTDLTIRLADAYMAADRCADAEALYRRLAGSRPEYDDQVMEAVVCQTPTPTPTPWIPSQQSTPTPGN